MGFPLGLHHRHHPGVLMRPLERPQTWALLLMAVQTHGILSGNSQRGHLFCNHAYFHLDVLAISGVSRGFSPERAFQGVFL